MNYYTQVGIPQPTNAEEARDAATVDGMRRAIFKARFDSPLIRSSLDTAAFAGMRGEDTYVLLAYNALLQLERYNRQLNDCLSVMPSTRVIEVKEPKPKEKE